MKAKATAAACALLLTCGAAFAAPTAQQKCDFARITAWKKYSACIENVVAKDAKGLSFDEFATFARCRHTYFKRWAAFQNNGSLAGSTCIGSRFVDNGDQTVTDNLSALVWEKKDNLDGTENSSDAHDADNSYVWGSGPENGGAFMVFLDKLNDVAGFAGSNGWRLPTLAEIQTILLDFSCRGPSLEPRCSCPATPCVAPGLDTSQTFPGEYWSSTTALPSTHGPFQNAWRVSFVDGRTRQEQKTTGTNVRAVRSGF